MKRRGLRGRLLDRLISVARETGIHLTELRQLGKVGFIDHSRVLRLDLEHLLERLCAEQLLREGGSHPRKSSANSP